MIGYEATCRKCGETFNPADETDLEHCTRLDGEPCGGEGRMVGSWGSGPSAANWEYQAGELPIRLPFTIKVF